MAYFGLLIFMVVTFAQPQEFIPIMKGIPLAYFTLITVSIFYFLGLGYYKNNFLKGGQQTIIMLLFWFLIIVSTIKVMWLPYTLNTAIEWGKVFVIFFLIVQLVNSEKKVTTLLWFIVLSLSVTAILGILQFYGNDITGSGMIEGRVNGIGIFATNQLAYALCYIFPICFALFLICKNLILRSVLFAVSILFLYCLFLTQSRGGFLCLFTVGFLLAARFSKKRWIKIVGVALSLLLLTLLIRFAPRFSTSFQYRSDSSATGRLDAWGYGLIELKQNLGFGIGKGQFIEGYGRAAHNAFVETATELGLIGFLTWFSLFYFSLKNLRLISINSPNKNDGTTTIAKALEISLYAYLISCYFSSSAYYIPLYVLFAMVVVIQRIELPQSSFQIKWNDILKICGISGSVLVLISLLSRY